MKAGRIEKVKHSLELDEKLSSQLNDWKAQKIGALAIMVVIVLTALGLFGNGLLSAKKVERSGITLQYEKFLRQQKEMDMYWKLSSGQQPVFRIPIGYLANFKIGKIVPDGYETHLSDGYVTYTFNADQLTDAIVHFYLIPQQTGPINAVWIADTTRFQIKHFIYP
ncbi:MAG TPA: hypothetical protein VNQ55_05780 [Parapedobacter sp.]|nr:hypothetical protein [Parapedobacter sp.]